MIIVLFRLSAYFLRVQYIHKKIIFRFLIITLSFIVSLHKDQFSSVRSLPHTKSLSLHTIHEWTEIFDDYPYDRISIWYWLNRYRSKTIQIYDIIRILLNFVCENFIESEYFSFLMMHKFLTRWLKVKSVSIFKTQYRNDYMKISISYFLILFAVIFSSFCSKNPYDIFSLQVLP